jgi:hypothetical protein
MSVESQEFFQVFKLLERERKEGKRDFSLSTIHVDPKLELCTYVPTVACSIVIIGN